MEVLCPKWVNFLLIKDWERETDELGGSGWIQKAETGDHLQYLHPLDHGKQVRGLGERGDKDLKKEMVWQSGGYAFTAAIFHLCSLYRLVVQSVYTTQDHQLECLTPPKSLFH